MLITYLFIHLLMVYADDNTVNQSIHPLCNCYSISLQSISDIFEDLSICYTYSIEYDSKNDQCQNNAVSVLFGICDGNDETQFTEEILQESITTIYPHQQISTLHSSEDSLLGVILDINDEFKICMKNINTQGLTSHNVQFILNNNDVITCRNDIHQSGLPCKSSNEDKTEFVAKYIENDDGLGHSKFKRIDIPQMDIQQNETADSGDIDNGYIAIIPNGLNTKESKVRVTVKEYVTFASVVVMTVIAFNAILCVVIAFRKSGYFNEMLIDDNSDDIDVLYAIDDDNPEDYISDIAQISHCIIDDIITSGNEDHHIQITEFKD